jgi:hypothetical protein
MSRQAERKKLKDQLAEMRMQMQHASKHHQELHAHVDELWAMALFYEYAAANGFRESKWEKIAETPDEPDPANPGSSARCSDEFTRAYWRGQVKTKKTEAQTAHLRSAGTGGGH